ncbi:aa3-type cytochrome c oxidase subunit IV [Parasphingorhabdus sp.]
MASENEIKSAEETYGGFISWLKIGAVITALVTVLVIILIS